jgi:hypothetical protein
MKKKSIYKALLLVTVAMMGVAIAISCKKETVNLENHGSIEPPDNIIDSLQRPFIGTWVSRGASNMGDPVCSPTDKNLDTITFLPNHTLLYNCDYSSRNGLQYTILSDTTIQIGTLQYDVKFTNADTLIIYNWGDCGLVISIIINKIFTKINN